MGARVKRGTRKKFAEEKAEKESILHTGLRNYFDEKTFFSRASTRARNIAFSFCISSLENAHINQNRMRKEKKTENHYHHDNDSHKNNGEFYGEKEQSNKLYPFYTHLIKKALFATVSDVR